MKSKQNVWFVSQIGCLLIVAMRVRVGSTCIFIVFWEMVSSVGNPWFGLGRFPAGMRGAG